MKNKRTEKIYIYERDHKSCYFCGKGLLLKQISFDHYLPKSKGGPNDLFNLVTSCKKCNKNKKSFVPRDYKEVILNLFLRAIEDDRILLAGIKMKKQELKEMAKNVIKVESIGGEYTIFQSNSYRFYVNNNKIYKIECIIFFSKCL